jgi:hypothetical protein
MAHAWMMAFSYVQSQKEWAGPNSVCMNDGEMPSKWWIRNKDESKPFGKNRGVPLAVHACALRLLMIWKAGKPLSEIELTSVPRLNPNFAEWLLGWPIGWTEIEWSGTELTHWLQLMRSQLSSLVRPMEQALLEFDYA